VQSFRATTINGGTRSVSSLAAGGANSGIGASTNAAANLVINGGTLQYATGSTLDLSTSGRAITFNPSNGQIGGFINTNGNTVTFANAVGAGSFVNFSGSGLDVQPSTDPTRPRSS
jgi:fibronectin-binding autotransporter adhesin